MTETNWIRALKRCTLKRLKIECSNPVSKINKGKYKLVIICSKPRFALKEGMIYGSDKHGDINKKECYGPIESWKEWDWSGYYPFKRSLYDWNKKEEVIKKKRKKSNIRRRKDDIQKAIEDIQSGAWPYTGGNE